MSLLLNFLFGQKSVPNNITDCNDNGDEIKRYLNLINQAIEMDRVMRYPEALALYKEGLDGLLAVAKNLPPDSQKRKLILKEFNKHLSRAEELQQITGQNTAKRTALTKNASQKKIPQGAKNTKVGTNISRSNIGQIAEKKDNLRVHPNNLPNDRIPAQNKQQNELSYKPQLNPPSTNNTSSNSNTTKRPSFPRSNTTDGNLNSLKRTTKSVDSDGPTRPGISQTTSTRTIPTAQKGSITSKPNTINTRQNVKKVGSHSKTTSPPKSKQRDQSSELEEKILSELLDQSPNVTWNDIAGLDFAKETLHEAVVLPNLRPDLFTGLRSPPKGVLLFGPPGTGKTMLAKAVASESNFKFFSISASSITSKFVGEGEKLVRALFQCARNLQPSVIFIDEIDSILSKRGGSEHEASRRLKTEFMIQLDGATTQQEDRILVMGATNLPHELDDAVLRRLVKRVYVPLPDQKTRKALIEILLRNQSHRLNGNQMNLIVRLTEGYSCSDLTAVCREAAMQPIRDLGRAIQTATAEDVRPILKEDFEIATSRIRPSVAPSSLAIYEKWNEQFGSS